MGENAILFSPQPVVAPCNLKTIFSCLNYPHKFILKTAAAQVSATKNK